MTITEILRKLNVRFVTHGEHHHVTEGWLGIDCPYCSPRSLRFRMGVPKNGRVVSCWICGKNSLAWTLHKASGVDYDEVKLLSGTLERQVERDVKHPGALKMPKGVVPLLPLHKKYLIEKRGLDPDELAAKWDVMGIGKDDRLPWRVFIPVTLDGEVVSWTTRTIVPTAEKNKAKRYVNAMTTEEAVSIKQVLYGADRALHGVVVTEGPFDAWRIGRGGVATMGVGYSRAQLLQMSRFPVRVVCFDNEYQAQKRAKQLCEELNVFAGETVLARLSAKDAGCASDREIRQLRGKIN